MVMRSARWLIVMMAVAVAAFQGTPTSAASFDCMRIAAVMGGAGENTDIQYVELLMSEADQTAVGGQTLKFRDVVGDLAATFTFPSDVAVGFEGSSILIATQEFADNATVAPDFIFSPSNTTAEMVGADVSHPVPVPAGKLSYAEGSQNCLVGGPFVVDSVAYGSGYTGPVDYGSKFPSDLPTVGTRALVIDSMYSGPTDNATEYSVQIVASDSSGWWTPRNNAYETGSIILANDSDGDGLTNDDEVNIYGSDPNDIDTDNDQVNDYDEVTVHGTDPVDADTDDDGYTEGEEVFMGTLPLVA